MGNPVNRIDADGKDWYETLDHTGVTWFEGNGQRDGFTNIGETYVHQVDNTMSVTYTQNLATNITYIALNESGFVSQFPDKTGCKVAADKMVENSGATPSIGRTEEILMTNHDSNGVATTPTVQAEQGVATLLGSLQEGKAVTVGVDYKPKQVHNLSSSGGDGMTDHFVTIVSSTTSLTTGETTMRFFDPGTSHKNVGTQQSNVFRYNEGKLQGTFNKAGGRGYNNYTVTTVRKVF